MSSDNSFKLRASLAPFDGLAKAFLIGVLDFSFN